ncbi:hypothetical protein GE21DRAFT_1088335 [Neurospora crassa]|nr:hypothetical protein GE21DRAFT_1088335 [Neurospora crassa]
MSDLGIHPAPEHGVNPDIKSWPGHPRGTAVQRQTCSGREHHQLPHREWWSVSWSPVQPLQIASHEHAIGLVITITFGGLVCHLPIQRYHICHKCQHGHVS